jgi:hypothetical protein
MMARDRGRRFANAAEVGAALNGAIALLTSSAGQTAASVTLQ